MSKSLLSTYLAIAPQSSEEGVLRVLIELGAQVVGADEGSLLVHDVAKNDLVFAMTVGGSDGLLGMRVPLDKGLTGLAAATREVQIGAPTFKGIAQAEEAAGVKHGTPQSVIAAPMLVADELVGVITAVTFHAGKRFTSHEGHLYARLAAIAGVVVHQRRQLNTIADMHAPAPRAEGEELEVGHAIAQSVARISRQRPAALARVARLLSEIEGLVGVDEKL